MTRKKKAAVKDRGSAPSIRPPRAVADRLVLQHADQILPGQVLVVLLNSTAVAPWLIMQHPEAEWNLFTFEHFFLTSLVDSLSEHLDPRVIDANIELFCTPDLPDTEFDTIVLPTDSRGSAELTRDVLQSVIQRLKPQGRLVISTNNARDHWLHEQLKKTFSKVTVHKEKDGICYVGRGPVAPKKIRNFDCEFAFRDGDRLIRCCSRPGVFSHRRIDAGARALIASMELIDSPPDRIVEMGCGCGAVATAAALRFPGAQILAVDSHARAAHSTELTAQLNDADNVSVALTSSGEIPEPGTWDVFLCNPPYYSDFRISELFLQSAASALRPGGRLHVVTKLSEWHCNRMIELFANANLHRYGEYDVIVASC